MQSYEKYLSSPHQISQGACICALLAAFPSYTNGLLSNSGPTPPLVHEIPIPSVTLGLRPNHPSLPCTMQLPFSTGFFLLAYKCTVISLILKTNSPLTLYPLQPCPVSFLPYPHPHSLLADSSQAFVSATPLKLLLSKSSMTSSWHIQRSVSVILFSLSAAFAQ